MVNRLSPTERCALGLTAGIGVCFKPQQALALLALEVFLALTGRSVRRVWTGEVLSLLAVGALYFLLIRTLTPLYFSASVPLVLDAYWAFGTMSLAALLRADLPLVGLLLAILIAAVALRRRLHEPALPLALATCSAAAYAAYALQHKGWAYQRFPCEALLLLAAFALLLDLCYPVLEAAARSSLLSARYAVASALLLTAPLCAMTLNRRILLPPQGCGVLHEFLGRYPPGTSVFLFSTSLVNFQSVFDHRLGWASRFACLWLLPAIVKSEQAPNSPAVLKQHLSPDRLGRLAAFQRTATAEDLNLWKPTVILVEHCTAEHPCQAIEGLNFEMIPWFLKDPAFAEAWSHYSVQPGAPPDFDLYTRVR